MSKVAVVTMKPHLRGRVRREVSSLLDAGHEVFVIGLASDDDFLQGLSHENLRVELIRASSVYVRTRQSLRALFAAKTPAAPETVPDVVG